MTCIREDQLAAAQKFLTESVEQTDDTKAHLSCCTRARFFFQATILCCQAKDLDVLAEDRPDLRFCL